MLSFTRSVSRGNAALRGLLAAVLGTVLMVWPSITIGTVVVLFAVYAFTDAVVSIVQMFRDGQSAGDRVLLGLRSLAEIAAGVIAIAYPEATAGAITVVIGVYAMFVGFTELSGSHKLSRLGVDGSGWLAVSGALALVTGIALVIWPGIGAVTLALVFGAYLAIAGIVLLISAAVTPRGETVSVPA
jgi:uncharacterized membrane protein HdeD (DUF308 family)